MSLAFKRRTFGLCFRCLASDHFVAECCGSIRCLGCGQSGHRERDCKARHAPSPHICSHKPPRPPGHPSGVPACQAPLPCSSPPPSHRPLPSWVAVVAQQGDSMADLGAPTTEPSLPAVASRPLQTLLAARAEGLSTELQAFCLLLVLKCISELPSPFHQFGLLVVLASA
jgi:hypothetical protein